jgi:3-keto-disaccharide hydrolase
MNRHYSAFTLSCLACAIAVPLATRPSAATQKPAGQAEGGWISLFDGKSMNGWRGYKKTDAAGSRWSVENGILTLPADDGKDTRGARDIITTETFDHFDLTWEWKIAQGGNSGLKYFVLEDMPSAIGHEYQLIDDERHPDAKVGPKRQTASLYDVLVPENRKLKPAGEWNTSRVVVRASTVEHYLNDGRVLTYELDSPALNSAIQASKFKDVARFGKLQKGHILLQDHGNQVWYRNIKIRRLAQS